ncbi:MAG TPA: hypothetical protein VL137_15740 [Polyangiaceae bacterium]|nr:hypothetical protein [Polyangiaceae bacterium]
MRTRLWAPTFCAQLAIASWASLGQAADDSTGSLIAEPPADDSNTDSHPDDPTSSAATPSAGATAPAPPASTASTPSTPAASVAADSSLESARMANQFGLRLALKERGPDEPWRLWIKNEGATTVALAADTKLLFLEVEVPGKKDPKTCILPSSMREGLDQRIVVLAPGEVVFRHIDPRFYCFSEGEQDVLVPGAIVKPRYGWPDETKASWKKGKRVTETLPPAPPFVAKLQPVDPSDVSTNAGADAAGNGDSDAATANGANNADSQKSQGNAAPPAAGAAPINPSSMMGVRHLEGSALALGSAYSVWSAASLPDNDATPLRVRVIKGSDSDTERSVTVTVAVSNQTESPLHLFLRRELLSFEVLGPTGDAQCAPEEDVREPESQSFITLRPHAQTTLSSRLVELCPRGTFLEPGLYLVTATLHAKYDGQRFNLHAFTGDSAAEAPKPVRVRRREEPFLTPAPLTLPSAPGAPTPAPPPTPAPVPAPPAG